MFVHTKAEKNERTQSSAAGYTGRSKKGTGCCLSSPVQREPVEEEPLQGKFPVQRLPEEEEPLQGSFSHRQAGQQGMAAPPVSTHGIPLSVQTKMEGALNTSLAGVTVHPNSGKATEVGALAYTQGTDIHVAPGHYSPHTSSGQRLLGHELAHVAQQMEGRVQPTGEVGGLPLNDSPTLEKEADNLAAKAV
jgi:hypothetical protein